MFALVNTFNALPDTHGTVISVHPTFESAVQTASDYLAAVRAANGSRSYLPLEIHEVAHATPRTFLARGAE